jgi:hypothetical protein
MRMLNRKLIVFGILTGFIVIGNLALKPPDDEKPVYKNLKVLSKDISEEKMEQIMHSFNSELGVTCIYCHVIDSSSVIPKEDFASDKRPEKQISRDMLSMTFKLNRKYFNSKVDGHVASPVKIWCATCHHGLPKPILPEKKTGK